MIRLTRCTQASKAGTYFRLHLQAGDNPAHPAAPGIVLRPSWVGSALGEVKIAFFNPPTSRQIVRLSRGLHPAENKRLAPSVNRKRAYYDLTISCPKTISLLSLLQLNHAVAKNVMQAHLGAIEVVTRAAGKMIHSQNPKGPATAKWLGVAFHHTHSREGDPHLHSHLILPNLMLNTDGQWRAMQVVIAGPNRSKLELLYGHHLATRLRRLGFGPEIVMRQNGLPEIASLQPLTRRFSKARIAVISADWAAESERATREGAKGRVDDGSVVMNRRSQLPRHPARAALQRRQRLADQMRKPKAKAADDPVKLTDEAQRWVGELSTGEFRGLVTLLDDLDYTSPRRQAIIVREGPPPPAYEIVQQAAFMVPEGAKTTGPVLFRAAVVLSGGRHAWKDLLAESREKMARRKKALARIRAQNEAETHAIAAVEIEQANQTVILNGRVEVQQTTPLVAESTGLVAPGDAAVAAVPKAEETTTRKQPRGQGRR